MRTVKVTTRSPEEIDAAFTAVCKDIKPVTAAKPVTPAERLAPYRKAILKQRRRGLSWRQLAKAMHDPRIGERVSDKLLREVFGAVDPVARRERAEAAGAAAAAAPRPPVEHLILDPLTGRRVT